MGAGHIAAAGLGVFLSALAGGCGPPKIASCNGDVALCSRPFDEVAFATAHNAMSSAEEGWAAPNHQYALARQLNDGVRAFMWDVHEELGEVLLCHSFCYFGSRPLQEALEELRDFMDAHPGEVITLIFESYVSGDALVSTFQDSGLGSQLHAQPEGAPWPSLEEMIAADRRLVVLTDEGAGTADWLLDVWRHAWDTDWSNQAPSDFDCEVHRGSADNPLFILNHFLTDPIATPELAGEVNANPFFLDRTLECSAQAGRIPNFVTVDFYAIGEVFDVIASLNALETTSAGSGDRIRADRE